MTSDVIARLDKRRNGFPGYPLGCELAKTIGEAADALEAAQAEIERLTAEADECHEDCIEETLRANKAEADNERLREALDKLARLGNEPHYGNSDGNRIAQAALADTGESDG